MPDTKSYLTSSHRVPIVFALLLLLLALLPLLCKLRLQLVFHIPSIPEETLQADLLISRAVRPLQPKHQNWAMLPTLSVTVFQCAQVLSD